MVEPTLCQIPTNFPFFVFLGLTQLLVSGCPWTPSATIFVLFLELLSDVGANVLRAYESSVTCIKLVHCAVLDGNSHSLERLHPRATQVDISL